MKISELRLRAEALVQRGLDELEMTVELKEFASDDVRMGELRERLREVKGRIKMLGTVNLLAYEEWREENDRRNLRMEAVHLMQRLVKQHPSHGLVSHARKYARVWSTPDSLY